MALSPEEIQNFARQRLALQQDVDTQRNRTQQDTQIGTRLLQEAGQRGQQEVGQQIASNGLFHSGIRVNAQGQVVREMNEGLGELQLNSQRSLQDLNSRLGGGMADINFNEQQTIANRGRDEAEREARRAELAAQAAAQVIAPPAPPPPVISLPWMEQPAFDSLAFDSAIAARMASRNRYGAGTIQSRGQY